MKEKLYYGSQDWANWVLVHCIEELHNVDRVLSARQIEVFYFLKELASYGYWWQVARLRNHIHLAIKQGHFTLEQSESDLLIEKGGIS